MRRKDRSYIGQYRSTRTQQERRIYEKHKKYVRGKRSASNLPNSWDDVRCDAFYNRRSWKSKRKYQYRCGKRGKKYEAFLDMNIRDWYVVEYLEENDIPYKIEIIKEPRWTFSWYKNKWMYLPREIGKKLTYWSHNSLRFPRHIFIDLDRTKFL